MTTYFKNLKIKEKFFFITCLIMLVVSFTSMVAFNWVANIYEQRIHSESAEVLNLTSSTVDNELVKIEKWSLETITDAQIQEYLSHSSDSEVDYETYRVAANLYTWLLNNMQMNLYISSLRVIDSTGETYTTVLHGNEDNNYDFETIAKEANGSIVWLPGAKDSNKLIAVRQIREMKNISLSHYGVLVIWVDMKKLVEKFLGSPGNKAFVITKDEQVVFYSQPTFSNPLDFTTDNPNRGFDIRDINQAKYLISHLKPRNHDAMTYYNILPYEVISQQTNLLRNVMMVIFVSLFLLALLFSRMAAHGITKSLVSLTDKMKEVQRGRFEIKELYTEDPNMDETGILHRNFRIMLEKINELFKENYQKQLVIQETEYRALQAQINPHFLYNTLDTINWMAKVNKQNQIAEMVEALGHMLRSVISEKKPLIEVHEELRIVNDYITIQKNRFDDRLVFELDIETELENGLIPKLTIQPIVENAVIHGLETQTGICRIQLHIHAAQGDIVIAVSDNGPGIDAQTLADLHNGITHSERTGIGLTNINERIKLMFGEQYGTQIESELGNGTTVTLKLPYQTR